MQNFKNITVSDNFISDDEYSWPESEISDENQEVLEIKPREEYFTLVDKISDTALNVGNKFKILHEFYVQIYEEFPNSGYTHITPIILHSILESISLLQNQSLINEPILAMLKITEWVNGYMLLIESGIFEFLSHIFQIRISSKLIVNSIKLLILITRELKQFESNIISQKENEYPSNLFEKCIYEIYSNQLPQQLISILFDPFSLQQPINMIDILDSEPQDLSKHNESKFIFHSSLHKKRNSFESILNKIKKFIIELLKYPLPPMISINDIYSPHLIELCIPKNDKIYGKNDIILINTLSTLFPNELISMLSDLKNREIIIFLTTVCREENSYEIKKSILLTFKNCFDVNPSILPLLVDYGFIDLISLCFVNIHERDITYEGAEYINDILDHAPNFDISILLDLLIEKNPIYSVKSSIFILFSKYLNVCSSQFLIKVLAKKEFLEDYIEWFFSTSIKEVSLSLTGLSKLLIFSLENDSTINNVFKSILDSNDCDLLDEILEKFPHDDPLQTQLQIIHDSIQKILSIED